MTLSRIIMRLARNPGTEFADGPPLLFFNGSFSTLATNWRNADGSSCRRDVPALRTLPSFIHLSRWKPERSRLRATNSSSEDPAMNTEAATHTHSSAIAPTAMRSELVA